MTAAYGSSEAAFPRVDGASGSIRSYIKPRRNKWPCLSQLFLLFKRVPTLANVKSTDVFVGNTHAIQLKVMRHIPAPACLEHCGCINPGKPASGSDDLWPQEDAPVRGWWRGAAVNSGNVLPVPVLPSSFFIDRKNIHPNRTRSPVNTK